MNSTNFDICSNEKYGVPVIIVAAGSSSRMKGINKQFMPVLGVPVIARTLMAFESCADVSKIIIVTAADSVDDIRDICQKYAISKLSEVVVGGANRHQSVMNGIKCLDSSDTKVMIHDGARPFIDIKTITEVSLALQSHDAALCVCKINDTVKQVSDDGIVTATVDRSMLYSAQTPQGVDVKKYISACETLPDVENLTDDASVMEAAGYNVKVVIGSARNIKITTPDDIAIAEALVKGEC